MTKNLLPLLFLFFTTGLIAQDDYHNYLHDFLGTNFSLPQGEWVFYDSETSIYQEIIPYRMQRTKIFLKKYALL